MKTTCFDLAKTAHQTVSCATPRTDNVQILFSVLSVFSCSSPPESFREGERVVVFQTGHPDNYR